MPVEHKLGRGSGDLWPSTVQLVGQALCLEEMTGHRVANGALLITAERRRVMVDIDAHREKVIGLIDVARERLAAYVPAVYSARRCRSCSVQGSCQPAGGGW